MMKTIITLIIALAFGFQYVSAQNQPAPQAPPKMISWNEQVHDFGKLVQSAPAVATFTFTNNGTEPVVISAARSSCGCTVAEYTKEPVKPGATGEVKATYNTARVGSFAKTVTVTFSGIAQAEVLTVKGAVEAKPAN